MPKKPTSATPESFEHAIGELEQLVSQMEAGALPLEGALLAYQRGSELVQFCAGQLDKIDSQVKVLEAQMLKPFQTDASA